MKFWSRKIGFKYGICKTNRVKNRSGKYVAKQSTKKIGSKIGMDICRQTKYQKNRSGNRSVNKNTKKIGQNIHPRQKERCDIGVDMTSRDGPGVGGWANCQEQL